MLATVEAVVLRLPIRTRVLRPKLPREENPLRVVFED